MPAESRADILRPPIDGVPASLLYGYDTFEMCDFMAGMPLRENHLLFSERMKHWSVRCNEEQRRNTRLERAQKCYAMAMAVKHVEAANH